MYIQKYLTITKLVLKRNIIATIVLFITKTTPKPIFSCRETLKYCNFKNENIAATKHVWEKQQFLLFVQITKLMKTKYWHPSRRGFIDLADFETLKLYIYLVNFAISCF